MKNTRKPELLDPTVLERAAAAVRELNQSPHASKALEAMIKSEEAKQAEFQLKAKNTELSRVRTEGEERRQTIEFQKQQQQQLADHQDKLARQRHKDQLAEQEASANKIRMENEESVRRQEEIRRETLLIQMKKNAEYEEKKIRLEAQLKAENYRNNFDLIQQKNNLKQQIEQQGRKDLHALYLTKARDAFKYLQDEPQALFTVAKSALLLSGAFFLSKYGLGVLFRRLEAYVSTPSLVRETSRRSVRWLMPHQARIFDRIVLNEDLRETLKVISSSLIAKQQQSAPLRNFLFYGQPGTGKTMFAKLLAYNSGLHYAVISGGDIEKLQDQAVPQIDKLFQWCNSTPKGTLVFIDEAETIFHKRSLLKQTSPAMSTFLAQTSSQSTKFSLILATNIPQNLDQAILDRMDSLIKFDYLDEEHRRQLLTKGFEQMLHQKSFWEYFHSPFLVFRRINIQHCLEEGDLRKLASEMSNFSPRQIDKFILSVYDSALGYAKMQNAKSFKITIEFVNKVLKDAQDQNSVRREWSQTE